MTQPINLGSTDLRVLVQRYEHLNESGREFVAGYAGGALLALSMAIGAAERHGRLVRRPGCARARALTQEAIEQARLGKGRAAR